MTYTREQILSMPKIELNILAAELVMRWTVNHEESKRCYPAAVVAWVENNQKCWRWFTPTVDIKEAMDLLEKPEIMDKYQLGIYPTSFGKWICRSFMPGYDIFVQADTAPEAITKAAILAMMESGGTGE